MDNLVLKYYHELDAELEKVAVGRYAEEKLADNRVSTFLWFALHSVVKFDYTRIGVKSPLTGNIIRKGSSGTRDGTCDLSRVPAKDKPKGPPLSQAVVIRYYDLSTSRKAWRSFRRNKFQSINAVLDDNTGRFTTDFNQVVNSGQVPPPSFTLSRTEKRKLLKIVNRNGH